MTEIDYPPRPIEEMWAKAKPLTSLTEEEFRKFHADRVERQSLLPKLGQPAPDFELENLDPEGGLSGERYRLSQFRGKPVGLAFGSFT